MPDITMCVNDVCKLKEKCFRHSDSGTKPTPYRQSYSHFNEKGDKDCDYYWRVDNEKN
jgi:hypothetical protein